MEVEIFINRTTEMFSRFGDTVENEFYLSTHRRRSDLLAAINRLGFDALGNRRNVEAALNQTRTEQFTSSRVRFPVFKLYYRATVC